jgi:hypothetical protein
MNWYEWNTIEDFNTWHNALCLELGYPIVSVNQLTGQPDYEAVQTTSYTNCFNVDGKVIANVEDQYADGLTLTELRLPKTERN